MSVTRALVRSLSVAVLGVVTLGAAPAAAQPAPGDGTSRFTIIVRGVRVGTENVDVSHTPTGIKISSVGQLAPPFDLVTTKFEMLYATDGHPQRLTIEGQLRGQPITLSSTFGITTVTTDVTQGPQTGTVTHQVSPRAIVLPSNFFAAYEALAARLGSTPIGSRVPIYVVPDNEVSLSLDKITPRRLVSPGGTFELKQYDLSVVAPTGASQIQVWTDANGRLARVVLPATSVVVMRDDLSSVMARVETVRNPGDEDVFVGAAGFNLGATMTRPESVTGKMPAVILIGGPGQQDRDEMTYGVPKFGQIAGELAAAGYFVVRYDKRGVGQSGGRQEHAGLLEYAQDAIAVATWLRKRRDIDPDRITLVGFAEGAAVALTAADKDKKINGVTLLAAAGTPGRDITLEQQRLTLVRLNEPEPTRQSKIAMQNRVIDAVLTGRGWEGIPEDVRYQADTAWFKSWLLFDPAAAIAKVKLPLLIVHGAIDRETPPLHANRLEEHGQARKGVSPARTRKAVVPSVNHILTVGQTGEVDEYDLLPTKTVAPAVAAAILDWLKALPTLPK